MNDDWISSVFQYLESQVNWETIVTNSLWGIIILVCLLARKAIRNGVLRGFKCIKVSGIRLLTKHKRHREEVASRPQVVIAEEMRHLLEYSNNSIFKFRVFLKNVTRSNPSFQIIETEITSGTTVEYKTIDITIPMDVAWDFALEYFPHDYESITTGANEVIFELYASKSNLTQIVRALKSRSLHKKLSSDRYLISPHAFIVSLIIGFELKRFGKRRVYMPIDLPDGALIYRGMQEKILLQAWNMEVSSEIFKNGMYSSDATGLLFVAQSGERYFPIVGYDRVGDEYRVPEEVFVSSRGLVLIQEYNGEVKVLKLSKNDLAIFKSVIKEWGIEINARRS